LVLPDTSVWVEFSRRGARGRSATLAELLGAGEVATCGPVAAELLVGARGEVADRMWTTLSSLPWAQLDQAAWHEVGAAAGRLRRSGQTLALTDLAIAVAAQRAGFALWSFDSDFERITAVLEGLELHVVDS
jgi:predicted nucleic acid-binding protein